MNIVPRIFSVRVFFSFLASFVIFIISLNILWSGEKSYGQIKEQVDFLKKNVTQAPSDKINPEHDKKLVYVVGVLSSPEDIRDKKFNLKFNALKYLRKVEMYQWQESKQNPLENKIVSSPSGNGGHHYHKNWFEGFFNSSKFHHKFGHQNPSSISHKSLRKNATVIKLGPYTIHQDFHKRLSSVENIKINDEFFSQLPEEIRKKFGPRSNYLASGDLDNPKVGDLKISFYIVPSEVYSIIGQQKGEVLNAFNNEYADDRDHGKVALIRLGKVASDQMIEDYFAKKQKSLWMPRIIAFGLLFAGFILLLRTITSVAKYAPSSLVIKNAGAGFLSLLLALFTQLIAMFAIDTHYLPTVSLVSLVMAVFVLIMIVKIIRVGYERYRNTKNSDNNYSFDEMVESEKRTDAQQSKLMMLGSEQLQKHKDGSLEAIQSSQGIAIKNIITKYQIKDREQGLLKGEAPEPSIKPKKKKSITKTKKHLARKKKFKK